MRNAPMFDLAQTDSLWQAGGDWQVEVTVEPSLDRERVLASAAVVTEHQVAVPKFKED